MVEEHNVELFNQLVSKLDELVPLPANMKKLIELTRDPNSDFQEIVSILEKDQAMVSKVLKLANSSAYGFSKQVKTISHAVVCLGYNTIKGIVLASSSHSILNKGVVSYALEEGALFRHSFAVATGARILAGRVKHPNPDEIYVMGLLHDVGKVVLDQYARQKFIDVIRLFRKGGITFLQAEQEVLGFNHGEIGAKVAEKWNLSDDLVESIRFHHDPQRASETNMAVHMVHIADVVSELLGIGLGYDGLNYELQAESMVKLGIDQSDIEDIIMQLMDEIKADDVFEG